MADRDKLPPIPSIPPPPGAGKPPTPPPPARKRTAKRSKSGAFRHLGGSRNDKLQDFARTGFAGYRRVAVAEKRRGPSLAWWLVGVLVLVAAGLGLYRWQSSAPEAEVAADPVSTVAVASGTSARIDPEAWRVDLESFEGYLFASPTELGPLGQFSDGFRQEAEGFAGRLRANGGADGEALAGRLDQLSSRTERSDFNVRHLQELRAGWLEARKYFFADAGWLRDGDAADEVAETEVYRLAAEQVRDLLSSTLYTADDLLSGDISLEERREQWRETHFYFRDDLKVIRAGLPRRPSAGASAETLDAVHRLDRVFIEAEQVATKHQTLRRLDRAAFETAIDNAEEAADFFDRRLDF